MNHLAIGSIEGVSTICLGGGSYGSQISEAAAARLLDAFAEAGGTFVDTAHIYGAWDKTGLAGGCGNSEVAIGRWMKARNCRDRMIIGTKGGHPDFNTGETCMTREGIRRHLHESLDHLQTDYIDIYWFHRDDRAIPVADILGWMQEPVAQGLIRVLGCSNWRTGRIAEARAVAAAQGLPLIEASQISWSLAQDNHPLVTNKFGEQVSMDDATWEFHRRTQLPQVAYNGQAGGFFALYDGYDEKALQSPDFPRPGVIRKYGNELTWQRRRLAQALAKKKGCTANHIALAWMLHQPFPTFPIIGPGSVEHLTDSLRALSIALSPAEVEMLGQGPKMMGP